MNKKVLAIYFSQTGQLENIIDNFTSPLVEAGNTVEKIRVQTKETYPFPWSGKAFFALMPDCVKGRQTELQSFELKEKNYDLIVLGYQAWFLSPGLPTNAILSHPSMQSVLKNTPIITVTGARNMWISAMEKLKLALKNSRARLVGNIALVDKHHNFISFVTLLRWMFKGKKDKYLGIFPTPGIADEDILNTKTFGATVEQHLEKNNWDSLQDELIQQKAVVIKYPLMFIESKARKIFAIWAGIIDKKKNKTAWLVVFKYYLLIALFIAAPIILTVDAIFFKPFLSNRIKKQKQHYAGVN
jgi:hypothetical protein